MESSKLNEERERENYENVFRKATVESIYML